MEEEDFEKEQLEYLRRHYQTFTVTDDTINSPDILKRPISRQVILNKDQENLILNEMKNTIKTDSTHNRTFTLKLYFEIISKSFLGIMDDVLNFDGNLENIKDILTKDDRLVFIATIIIIVAIVIFFNMGSSKGNNYSPDKTSSISLEEINI